MLGDVLLITDIHRRAAQSILERALEDRALKGGDTFRYIIAISGESGAGKSELAHSIALLLKKQNIRAKVVHTDNYYKIPPPERSNFRKEHGMESVGLHEYDWNLINNTIEDYKRGREAILPCIDIVPGQVDKLITNFEHIEFLVVDGLYAIKIDQADLRVFIDLTYQETKISQLTRGKEVMDEYRLQVLAREHMAVASLRPLADLIVNKNYDVVDASPADMM